MLDRDQATRSELRGQAVFFGKGRCGTCHVPPYCTDNLMHDLMLERFYEPRMINGIMATAEGPIKTFSLRGIKDSPPYLHDGRLLTLDLGTDVLGLAGFQRREWTRADRVPPKGIPRSRAMRAPEGLCSCQRLTE